MDNLPAFLFGFGIAVLIGWLISESKVESNKRIEPEIKVVQQGSRMDTTYIYNFGKQ